MTRFGEIEMRAKMRTSRASWQEYDRWNEVIADVVFPERDVPVPVYLDVEDHEIREIGARLGVPAEQVVDTLMHVVGQTIDLDLVTGAFNTHVERVLHWQRGRRQDAVYPEVALLAVFSLAAEQMAAGDGMASANYYGRLAQLLDAPKRTLHQSYVRVAEPLWAGLNFWLERLDGRRGTPTAYALGKRFVGLPMSQALVREADRRRLERFFSDFDLAPRAEIPGPELEPLLGTWFDREHQTSHLGRLWQKAVLRERIAEVASIELQAWDGIDDSDEPADGRSSGRALLALQTRTFPKPQVRVFPLFLVKEADVARSAVLVVEDGEADVLLEPATEMQNAMALADRGAVDPASLLGGVLNVRDTVGGDMVRSPRGVVVFRRDELSGLWFEARQVLLGDDVVVVAMERAAGKVRDLLGLIARPGWQEDQGRPGLPAGWTLFEKIEVFARPADEKTLHADLRALVPLTSSQLKLVGGISLPGISRNRWHSARPPHVRALSDGAPFAVRLVDLGLDVTDVDDSVVDRWEDGGTGTVLVDGADLDLADGRYAVEMLVGDDVVARREFSLHSSDSRDELQWARVEPIVHDLGDPLAVLGAGGMADGIDKVQGVLVVSGAVDDVCTVHPPAAAWWKPRTDQARSGGLTLRAPDPKSCFYTGAHRFDLPTAYRDNDRSKYESPCTQCGMRKNFSGSYYRNAAAHQRRQDHIEQARRVDVSALPPVPVADDAGTGDWDVALDALRCLGGGTMASLERVVRQVEASSLFVAEFVSTLEALGHLEVRRSPSSLAAEAWEIAPTSIVDTGGDRVLTGFWTPTLVSHAEKAARSHGRAVTTTRPDGGLTRTATDATEDDLDTWLDIEGVLLPGRAGWELAARLPSLSRVVAALPRVRAVSFGDTQIFDPRTANWTAAYGMDAAGAYRVGRYASTTYIRTEADIEAGTTALAPVYLAKHWAAAALAGKPLLAYSERGNAIAVPLGALLPGLYQRAVVLDSGHAPERLRGNHVYRDVSPDIAARITHLLES